MDTDKNFTIITILLIVSIVLQILALLQGHVSWLGSKAAYFPGTPMTSFDNLSRVSAKGKLATPEPSVTNILDKTCTDAQEALQKCQDDPDCSSGTAAELKGIEDFYCGSGKGTINNSGASCNDAQAALDQCLNDINCYDNCAPDSPETQACIDEGRAKLDELKGNAQDACGPNLNTAPSRKH